MMLKHFETHPQYRGLYQRILQEYQSNGAFFLEETYLRDMNDRLKLFPRTIDAICADAQPTDNNGTIARDAQPVITSVTIREEPA